MEKKNSKSNSIGLLPTKKACRKCGFILTSYMHNDNHRYFHCPTCNLFTIWNYDTLLSCMRISVSSLEILLHLFTENHAATTAHQIINADFIGLSISLNTVERYFRMFSQIALNYYTESHNSILLEGEVEIDETQLYREKKSFAPGRPYEFSNVWIIGFKERKTDRFLIFPTIKRTEAIFIPLLLSHVKLRSTIYTDCFSVYVNNKKFLPESKLQSLGYIHSFINHKISFVNQIFNNIHTNTIERLWRTLKEHTKKHKTKHLYLLCIGRFFFHKSLKKELQLAYLVKQLNEKKLHIFDLEV